MAKTRETVAPTPSPTRFVLPKPPTPGTLVVERERSGSTAGLSELLLAGQSQARKELGERLSALLECQDRFLAELRRALEETEEAVHGDSRIRLLRHCHDLGEILDWAEAVQADLKAEAEQARQGRCPVEIAGLLREEAAALQEREPELRIQVVEASSRTWTWGDPAVLRRGLRSAVLAVRERSSDGIAAEVDREGDQVLVRLLGLGEPRPMVTPDLADEVRECLGQRHGARLLPDDHGPAGTGLRILLPAAAAPAG